MARERLWWLNEESQAMLERGYLLPNQTVEDKLNTICGYASDILGKPELKDKFFEIFAKGWASLSSPIWANFGEGRGLPISCVTGETWINTKHGGKQAKDIKIGDLVLTHKNRFRKVTNVIPTKDKGDIWKLKVNTRMTDLFITGNHTILTNLGWVRVDELDVNKHLVAVNGKVDFGSEINHTIDMKDYTNYKFIIEEGLICKAVEGTTKKSLKNNNSDTHVTYYSKPREFVDVDEDLAWALGLWFAEGSVSVSNKKEPNGIRITLNSYDEKEVADKWLAIMSEKFNLTGNVYESEVIRKGKVNKWITANINGKVIGNLFESFGRGCKVKELPSWVLNLPNKLKSKVLEGFLLGDGSKDKNGGNRATVANPVLLLQLYNIGLSLGKDMSLQMQSKASKLSTTSHVYTLIFRGYENSLRKSSATSGIKFSDGLTYCPIVTLEKTDKIEDVYDFTVEEDHSFSCAGVVVHNCFTSLADDDTDQIFKTLHEVAMMTKNGGGTACDFSRLRAKGSPVSGGGSSSGVVSFIEPFDTTIKNVSQSGVRRGGFAAYLDINHPEILEFLRIKDKDSPMQSINTAVNVDDKFMKEMIEGDKDKRKVWAEVLRNRREKGIPYIFFKDTANNNSPDVYKKNNKVINSSNLCNEIMLSTEVDESLVCCLSSMNLYLYDEWKDTDAVELMIYFLDAVMEDFIRKTENRSGFERAHKFAKSQRALGLGVLGWHSYLQQKFIPFDSLEAYLINIHIFKYLQEKTIVASKKMAHEYGEPSLMEGTGLRHSTLIALAPTTSSASILGQSSPSIEPYKSNFYTVSLAKGSFVRKNKSLQKLLASKGKDTKEIWDSIMYNQGSIQHLEFLNQDEKDVFKTFSEINPEAIIDQAGARQKYIDQGQSLNLMIPHSMEVKEINRLHIRAWEKGCKGLYYQRGSSVTKEALAKLMECSSCSA